MKNKGEGESAVSQSIATRRGHPIILFIDAGRYCRLFARYMYKHSVLIWAATLQHFFYFLIMSLSK